MNGDSAGESLDFADPRIRRSGFGGAALFGDDGPKTKESADGRGEIAGGEGEGGGNDGSSMKGASSDVPAVEEID